MADNGPGAPYPRRPCHTLSKAFIWSPKVVQVKAVGPDWASVSVSVSQYRETHRATPQRTRVGGKSKLRKGTSVRFRLYRTQTGQLRTTTEAVLTAARFSFRLLLTRRPQTKSPALHIPTTKHRSPSSARNPKIFPHLAADRHGNWQRTRPFSHQICFPTTLGIVASTPNWTNIAQRCRNRTIININININKQPPQLPIPPPGNP